jgi:hypothetical protein
LSLLAKWKGNVGVLQEVKDEVDLAWLTKEAPDDEYMAVLNPDMFTRFAQIIFSSNL